MKKILLCLCLASMNICQPIQAQTFAPQGAQWYHSYTVGHAPDESYGVKIYTRDKDTLVNGKQSAIIKTIGVQSYLRPAGHELVDTTHYPDVYVYQNKDSLFLYNPQSKKFEKVYTFNVKKGDTITIQYPETVKVLVDSVQNLVYQGLPIKKYFTTIAPNFQFIYLDLVGGIKDLFQRSGGGAIPELSEHLKCYRDQQVNIQFTDKSCDQITALVQRDAASNVSVFPNPSNGIFSITGLDTFIDATVFDAKGRKLYTSDQSLVNMEHLPNGIYNLVIQTKDKVFSKVILKN